MQRLENKKTQLFLALVSVLLLLTVSVQLVSANIQAQSVFTCVGGVSAEAFGDSTWWNEPNNRWVINNSQLSRWENGGWYVVDSDTGSDSGSSGSVVLSVNYYGSSANFHIYTLHRIYLGSSYSGQVSSWDSGWCGYGNQA